MGIERHSAEEPPALYDAIGPWSEIKLEIIRKYAVAYSQILQSQQKFQHVYIDAFAGAGHHVSRTTELLVPGSPQIALEITPPFTSYYFIDIDKLRVSELEEISRDRDNVSVFHGDCNEILIDKVLPRVQYSDYRRGLCLLDPYGMQLDWKTVMAIAASNTVDAFLNFPIGGINRNVLRIDPGKVAPGDIERMNTVWGDDTWLSQFYRPSTQLDLWGSRDVRKSASNLDVAEAFRSRLKAVAGFEYVPTPVPMRNSKDATLYYLYFASHKAVAGHIVEDIFAKYRVRR